MIKVKKIIIIIMLIIAHQTKTEVGCMDNSQYMDLSCGYDYKKYHFVHCDCPCNRYAQSFHRGLCEHCLHFRSPKPLIID